ncbi:hypothetical protein CY35_05G132700 [Sphagnum magellanicum]|nr:hypothetical protein CY35_05G132700 [Sphagnum magellanicum]
MNQQRNSMRRHANRKDARQSKLENLHRATMYVIDHLSNEMQQGVETLCEYRGGGLFFLCFFFCRCREARRSRSFQTL